MIDGARRAGGMGDIPGGRDAPDPSAEGVCMTLGTAIVGAIGVDFGGEAVKGTDPAAGSAPFASAARSLAGASFPRLG